MNTLYLDLETFSPTPIKQGVYKYAEKAHILLVAYALDDSPVEVWDTGNDRRSAGFERCIRQARKEGVTVCAHNSNFDRTVFEKCFPELSKGLAWRDTMVRAYAHSLPGSLGQLSEIFKLDTDQAKDKEGKKLVQLFCKPNKKGAVSDRNTHPELWEKFIEYARRDVEAMRALDRKIPIWNDIEMERGYWYLDQKINDRGFQVDTELATAAVAAVKRVKRANDGRVSNMTEGTVSAATKRDQMLKYLLDIYGVDLPDMTISTLTRRLEDPDLPEPVKELIALRLEASGTSVTKYQTLLNSVCEDGRLRGTLQFCGAYRTLRYAGRIFQPQNLPRPTMKNDEIEFGIDALKTGTADLFFEDVKGLCGAALRSVIQAPEGKKLVVADLSAIEGRVLAWLAGEQWKTDAYQSYDEGLGYDMYVLTYAKTFGVLPETVGKPQRQMGKVLELALGYAGAVGAFLTFSKTYNIDLDALVADGGLDIVPDDIRRAAKDFYDYAVKKGFDHDLHVDTFTLCDSIKRMWRASNPAIVNFWADAENAVRMVCSGRVEKVVAGRCTFDKVKSWLRVQLPSGRYMCYPGIRSEGKEIKYLGTGTYSKKWGYQSTYGGKLVENITQATARDILMHGMQLAEDAGYGVVLSVHDELITETPDTPEFSAKGLSDLMATVPAWGKALPLAAAGFESYRYKKE